MKNSAKNSSELYTGSIFTKIIIFAIPLVLTGIFQLLYNAVDMVIVGRYAGKEALSAVGSTTALINLFINIFMGLSLGASVVVSRHFGAGDNENVSKTVHSSILLSIIAGIFLTIIGCIFAKPMLLLMETPDDVIELAVLYVRIFFCGMTFNMVYTYGSAILRAVGDTKRPLIFLTIAGVVNIVLNFIFVVFFNMGVAGVGIATITSQAVSMCMVVYYLINIDSPIRLDPKKLAFDKQNLIMLIKFGLPAGIQGSLFSLSNVVIQSSINIFGTTTIAGNAASSNIDGFLYILVNAFNQSNITFISQNIGAKQFARVRKGFYSSVVLALIANFILSSIFIIFSQELVGLYNSDPDVIAVGAVRLNFMAFFYFFCVLMHVCGGQLQALGRSMLSMIITLCGACIFRMIWIATFFTANQTIENLYLSYPLSWGLTAFFQLSFALFFMSKLPKENE